mmetsp:Transcript_38875/g.54744  ORF Transcript_38875/g.54744 Transcript_38875/m.54744 type:complete len:212 (+) Transcript_38875:393-1028(+)
MPKISRRWTNDININNHNHNNIQTHSQKSVFTTANSGKYLSIRKVSFEGTSRSCTSLSSSSSSPMASSSTAVAREEYIRRKKRPPVSFKNHNIRPTTSGAVENTAIPRMPKKTARKSLGGKAGSKAKTKTRTLTSLSTQKTRSITTTSDWREGGRGVQQQQLGIQRITAEDVRRKTLIERSKKSAKEGKPRFSVKTFINARSVDTSKLSAG